MDHIILLNEREDVSGVETVETFPCRWYSSTNPLDCDAHFPRMQYVCVDTQSSR